MKTGVTLVFIFSIIIVIASLASVVFPAIFTLSYDGIISTYTPDRYEPGAMAVPTVIVGISSLVLLFFYKTNRVNLHLEKLSRFEPSHKISIIIISILLVAYIAASTPELSEPELWGDYPAVRDRIDLWTIESISQGFEPHLRYFMIKLSGDIFDNQKVLPLAASTLLLLITYMVTQKITNSRLSGIVALVIVLQSNVFLTYDTSITYTNFWILLYMISLYCMYRFWPLAPIAYALSIPAKAITAAFVPMSIYFVLQSGLPKRTKLAITASVLIVCIGIIIAASSSQAGTEAAPEVFSSAEFMAGLASFGNQLRFDWIVTVGLFPLIIGLYMAARRGVQHADTMMIFISGMLLLAPLITAFTNQTNQPYRFLPLVVFFGIGTGVLLSKILRQVEETSSESQQRRRARRDSRRGRT